MLKPSHLPQAIRQKDLSNAAQKLSEMNAYLSVLFTQQELLDLESTKKVGAEFRELLKGWVVVRVCFSVLMCFLQCLSE
jgi:hypothetical protein